MISLWTVPYLLPRVLSGLLRRHGRPAGSSQMNFPQLALPAHTLPFVKEGTELSPGLVNFLSLLGASPALQCAGRPLCMQPPSATASLLSKPQVLALGAGTFGSGPLGSDGRVLEPPPLAILVWCVQCHMSGFISRMHNRGLALLWETQKLVTS